MALCVDSFSPSLLLRLSINSLFSVVCLRFYQVTSIKMYEDAVIPPPPLSFALTAIINHEIRPECGHFVSFTMYTSLES